jgi:predicted negative regulator of RcsB-dependent stress response
MALQNLDLEEQEQLAELKAWWKQYGNLVLLVIVAASLAVAGWGGWRWYQRNQAAQASALYDTLAKAVGAGDAKALRDAGGALTEGYPGTLYASMGALAAARFHFERNELKSAKAQLQWVLERSPSEEYREIARLRLAHVLLDEKAYDEALKVLEAKPLDAYAAQVAVLRGDVLLARNQPAEAKAAYRLALEKAGGQAGAFRESVQLRLDALGG